MASNRYLNKGYISSKEGVYRETYRSDFNMDGYNPTTFKVSAAFENRLDLVSFEVYGNPLYYWMIAEASNIINPFDVPIGTILTIPDINQVQVYGVSI